MRIFAAMQLLNKELIARQEPAFFLRSLIAMLRPANVRQPQKGVVVLRALTAQLEADAELNNIVSAKLSEVITSSRKAELFTQVHFLAAKGLLSELRVRLFTKIIPKLQSTAELKGLINTAFHKRNDYIWLETLPEADVNAFLNCLALQPLYRQAPEEKMVDDLLSNIYIISQVICSLSIDVNIVKNYSEVLEMESPFMVLHERIDRWIGKVEHEKVGYLYTEKSYELVVLSIRECNDFIEKIRANKKNYGTSIALTLVIRKLSACIERMNDLIHLLVVKDGEEYNRNLFSLSKKIVREENLKNSLRTYFNDTISLLAFQVTEHTGKIGGHYVTTTAGEYFRMLWDALKGGLIVGFLVISKFLINACRFPLLLDTLLKGLNYSLGFIGIQLIHGTLATKQPSMTAATIAHTIEHRSEEDNIKGLGDFIIKVFRSQFIAVTGNMLIAFPVAFGISYGWYMITGKHIATMSGALHKVHELNPFTSLCLMHAAIAGLMLFLSGILAGVAENASVFNNYPARIKNHPALVRIMGAKRSEKLGNYIGNNIGTLTGNFTLGFFLAFVAFFGYILGLPLDIQHVTFASGNLGLGLATMLGHFKFSYFLPALLGVVLIGVVNILVSFSLALVVAIKSRNIRLRRTGKVVLYLIRQFFRNPLQFFIPIGKK